MKSVCPAVVVGFDDSLKNEADALEEYQGVRGKLVWMVPDKHHTEIPVSSCVGSQTGIQ